MLPRFLNLRFASHRSRPHPTRSWLRCMTVWVTIFSFFFGSLGYAIPVRAVTAGDSTESVGSCCCGPKGGKCGCGCRPKPKAKSAQGSCCTKKSPDRSATQPTESVNNGPSLACPCSGTPHAEVAVSVQPKVVPPRVQYREVDCWAALVFSPRVVTSEAADGPDTPPPRVSLG